MGGVVVCYEQGATAIKTLTENSRITTVIRDLLNDAFTSIHVNDQAVFDDVCAYIGTIAPRKRKL